MQANRAGAWTTIALAALPTPLRRPQTPLEMDRACKLGVFAGHLALASCSAGRSELQRALQQLSLIHI
eukprot:9668741-Alexandrium_andersonii.AAC.1